MIKRKYFYLVLFFLIIQIFYFQREVARQNDLQLTLAEKIETLNLKVSNLNEKVIMAEKRSFVNSHRIPDVIYFCNESINLDDEQIRESVEREFYALLGNQGQIQLYLKRMKRFFPLIEKHLRNNNLPQDLKYLAVHESALLPHIRSRASAMGIWQFMSRTARRYGLTVNWYFDERRDPEKSTIAAVKYLQKLYSQFETWPLAMAAYNGGPTRLRRAIRLANSTKITDLELPSETERYYFKIVATKIILDNAIKYGFEMEEHDFYKPIDHQKQMVKITESRMTLQQLSEEHNIDIPEIRKYNPAILRDYLPRGEYEINFPLQEEEIVSVFETDIYEPGVSEEPELYFSR